MSSDAPKDGGPAFPGQQELCPDGTWNQTFDPGMSLRDWFAGQAIEAVLKNYFARTSLEDRNHAMVATTAYAIADALLKAREAKP